MNPYRKKIIRMQSAFLACLLGLLGIYTSCVPKAEYGCPEADFIIKGVITSDSTGDPIDDIEIVCYYTYYSDSLGKYEVTRSESPNDQTFTVNFHDTDDSLNGSFQDVDTNITFNDPQFTGGNDDWYEGSTTKIVNISMKPKP